MNVDNREDDIRMFVLYVLREILRGDTKADIRNVGDLIFTGDKFLPIGGNLSQIEIDEEKILAKLGRVGCPVGCGHLVKSIDELNGFCGVCGRIICSRDGCLEICEETGITVCRECRVLTMDGRIVSRPAARKLSSILKSLIRVKKKGISHEERQERKLLR